MLLRMYWVLENYIDLTKHKWKWEELTEIIVLYLIRAQIIKVCLYVCI